ncbi:MAG: glutathione-disulfide reductase [Hydrogenophaga sp.]|uniref:glutathione-disulfide reductase n=1 Tax=Hydrogenophaga sp. TaxID=1904254 RepID=UPI002579D2A8|nr:glutathione-disulfide reductase [Hydrogenophaga sp.]MBL0944979.1 glutathione-disulfide reductase [Hydrogenophaga sp.]
MSTDDFDLFVIGGGSGGVRAARMAAQRGLRVALAERLGHQGLGGTCVNVGCIPKKLYSYAAGYHEAFEEAPGFGWQIDTPPRFDWATLKANRAQEIARLNGVYAGLLKGAGVVQINGFARFTGPHQIAVDTTDDAGRPVTQQHRAKHVLIATGGTPSLPDIEGREHILDSNAMFDLDPFPQRLAIVGGGYIASEFASIFNGLGARVTLINRGELLLRGFDDDIRRFVGAEMAKTGIDLRMQTEVARIVRTATGLQLVFKDGGTLEADAVLYATGRKPLTQGLGLAHAGVALGAHGEVAVNGEHQTSAPHVYAVGDVTGRVQLTPVALGEAMVVVDRLCGPAPGKAARQMAYENIPTAVFTHPNIGTVGLTETQARERHGEVTIFRSEFKSLRHTLSGRSERTLMKLVVDTKTDRVLGVHMVGAEAGEIVQGFAVALKAGATKAVFDSTIGIHPTAAEEFVTMREPLR